ncbi:YdgH/BhsA/McbA-like domain containing protein [uncultured Gilliamella sp.]|uniref:YdgH/BhsA/McbA-like domain containing protein n=1 Tax=uncultured Gilliamella sp. TaxID=1193505 RepID=UPI0025EBFA86|nr:YdgH/BhsA/McbA-like domain containing protein [uncultured Gilliamella sp.]
MRSIKKTIIATAIAIIPMCSFAAQQLNEEQATSLQSFKEISVRGAFYTNNDYIMAMSKAADKEGAAAFYITTTNISPSNDTLRIVYAKLYKADAPKAAEKVENIRRFEGVFEYPKTKAIRLEPFDIVRIRGYFTNELEINQAIAKEASAKGAYAFYIDSRSQLGSNLQIAAYLFKKDAPERKLQPENAIPYDSEAGQLALAQGGEAAMQVERPGYYSPSAFNEKFYADKFNNKVIDKTTTSDTKTATTASSESTTSTVAAEPQRITRYTVTLPDGRKIQELNDATAAKMVAFDTIKFRGYYVTDQEISYQAGKRAIDNGAKYYHIARIAQDTNGPNITVFVDLYR